MAVFRRDGSKFYFIGFEYKGRRYRVSARTTSRRQAEQLEAQLRKKVYDEVTLGRTSHEPMRFEDAVTRYVSTHLKTKERLDKTINAQSYLLARLVRLIGPDTILDDITTEVVANVKEKVFESGKRKPATVNQYVASLRAILRMAHLEWNRLAKLPRFKLYSLQNERNRWLRPEEEVRLLRACEPQPHLHDLVVFLLDTGARLSEACRLTWDQVDLPKRSKGAVRIFATKTQKWRVVPMTARTDTLLRRLHESRPDDQERVFLIRTVGTAFDGGGHERGFRSGTLNVPAIVGFGEACTISDAERSAEVSRLRQLRDSLWQALSLGIGDIAVNGQLATCLPNTLHIFVPRASAESIMLACDNIAMSAGSACTSASIEPSHVLRAMGFDDEHCHCSLRISLGRGTSQADIEVAASGIIEAVTAIRSLRAM